jgi:hypothetical protein
MVINEWFVFQKILNFAFILGYQGRRDSSVGIATRYRLKCLGIASRWELDFTCPPHRPKALPTICTVGTGSFLGLKWPGRGVNHLPYLAPRLKKEYTSALLDVHGL